MKSKIIFSTLALGTALTIGAMGVKAVQADDIPNPVVQRLSQKFNLNEDDVQAVFDAVHDERSAEMQIRFEERLQDLVESGDITEDQKKAILAKKEKLFTQRSEMANLDLEARKELMETHRAEMKVWADENGIDLESFKLGLGRGMGRGFKAGHHYGMDLD